VFSRSARFPVRSIRLTAAFATLSSLTLIAAMNSGCQFFNRNKQAAAAPTPIPTPAGPQPPKIDFNAVRPNELGDIPVIMYHEVKGNKDDVRLMIRSIASFKKDLEILYKNDFRPVNLSDVVNNNIDVPPGKHPVVLTFDDARASQFQLIETPTAQAVDPNCAVGLMEAFAKEHPDWKLRATFFVLPKSKATLEPFGQLGKGDAKMQYLVDKGMEIANHSTNHRDFRPYNAAKIQEELGYAHNTLLAAAPKAKIETVALPMGRFPRDKKLWPYLLKGTYQGKTYQYKAAVLAAWRPIPSPANRKYNPLQLERIDSINGLNGIRDWVKKLKDGSAPGHTIYISDGDPNVVSYPKASTLLANVAKLKAEGKLPYGYESASGGAKPIIGVGEGEKKEEQPADTVDTTPPGSKPITGAGG
jgi:peptidoglycan/xylan/chitin deacetylase (PgdA/CDA1 family)